MKDQECSRIKQAIAEAEFVLVGIGAEFREAETGGPDGTAGEERARLREAYDCLERLLKGKPYFVVTENADDVIFTSKLLDFFIAAPFAKNRPQAGEEQWNAYQNWLAATLGHKLCILELGVGFAAPQVIRWPFEKVAQYNLKATLLRVNQKFPQLGAEIAGRGISVAQNAVDWLLAQKA